MPDEPKTSRNFIEEIIDEDCRTLRWGTWPDGRPRVHTRFPPEPNGYLHIGHAKSICLNYGLARQYGGRFNLRFDDTNPTREEQEYVDSIIADVRWLGARWVGMREEAGQTPASPADAAGVLFASDYFQQMYEYAVELIRKGKAYVCDLSAEEIRRTRGTLTRPGQESPWRNRSVEENLELFERMRRGEFPDGSRTLRARIDMAHPNLNLRDPVMYRILHVPHQRTGTAWCIYPMYDWAHGLEDSIEGITHSICTLEFENHRPLYDWFIDAINEGRTDDGSGPWGRRIHHPRQIEFARLNLTYTVMSKRKLLHLVKGGYVRGWDDPRMPTLSGMRRRGYTPESIRDFCARIGVAKFEGVNEIGLLEACVREHLNRVAPRRMAVLRPLKLVITNWPADPHAPAPGAGQVEWLEALNNPEDPAAGTRKVPFSGTLYIERDDFMEHPPPRYWRLFPGNEVRLRYAYIVRCTGCLKDPRSGEVLEVHCTYDPATRGGDVPDGRKVRSTIHWVSALHAIRAEVRLYDHLFSVPHPEDIHEAAAEEEAAAVAGDSPELRGSPEPPESAGAAAAQPSTAAAPTPGGDEALWLKNLNPRSLEVITDALVEPSLAEAQAGDRFQFERLGYFCCDPDSDPLPATAVQPDPGARGSSTAGPGAQATSAGREQRRLVFNRTVALKDSYARQLGSGAPAGR